MSTDLQIEANRANAALSTGPSTAEGKAASARNAIGHGLHSQSLLPNEDPDEYAAHLDALLAEFPAADPKQVRELANLDWRIRRASVYEAQVLSLEMHRLQSDPTAEGLTSDQRLALAFVGLVEKRVLPNLFQQEARLSRRADKLRAALRQPAASEPPKPCEIRRRKTKPKCRCPHNPPYVAWLKKPAATKPAPAGPDSNSSAAASTSPKPWPPDANRRQ